MPALIFSSFSSIHVVVVLIEMKDSWPKTLLDKIKTSCSSCLRGE